jgi:hypothetical protein
MGSPGAATRRVDLVNFQYSVGLGCLGSYNIHTDNTNGREQMSAVRDVVEESLGKFEDELNDLPRVSASKLGLDPRAGRVWVDEVGGQIIVNNMNRRSMDYYGGFEYVSEDAISGFGDYTIYTDMYGDSRVGEALDMFRETLDEDAA